MAKDYDVLFSKYNVLIARNRDLKQELDTKTSEWEKRETEFHTTEKLARELCESILAHDKSEIKLGTDGSWDDFKTNELIRRAKDSYAKDRKNTHEVLLQLLNSLEERRRTIEDRDSQIAYLMTNADRSITQEDLDELVDKKKKPEPAAPEPATPTPKNPRPKKTGVAAIQGEPEDTTPEDTDLYDDIDNIRAEATPLPSGIPTALPRQTQEARQKARERALKEHVEGTYVGQYEKLTSGLSQEAWGMIQLMGETGISIYPDLEKELLTRETSFTPNKVRVAEKMLHSKELIDVTKISHPIRKILSLLELTTIGRMVYEKKFGKKAVESEMSRIAKEHDNYNHGYGIKALADELRGTNQFREVNEMNRNHPIQIRDGIRYIPDIVCKTKSGRTIYLEYECGYTTQTDFNGKCSKMMTVTDTLNFIGPNLDVANTLRDQVSHWIKNRGAETLKAFTIRVSNVSQIMHSSLVPDSDWKFVFKPEEKGAEAYVNS